MSENPKKSDIIKGTDLQNLCMGYFSNLGWDVDINCDDSKNYDLVLRYDGKVVGYVECISSISDQRMLANKIDRITSTISNLKDKYLFITNGAIFEIYYDGSKLATLSTPPSYDGLMSYRRVRAYYDAIKELYNER